LVKRGKEIIHNGTRPRPSFMRRGGGEMETSGFTEEGGPKKKKINVGGEKEKDLSRGQHLS